MIRALDNLNARGPGFNSQFGPVQGRLRRSFGLSRIVVCIFFDLLEIFVPKSYKLPNSLPIDIKFGQMWHGNAVHLLYYSDLLCQLY
jgi:hypothetical protein